MRLFVFKDLMGSRVRSVQSESIWQDESHGMDRAVGVLGHAAAHPAGVVGKDASHHAGIDRCRVRSEAAAESFEHVVEKSANHARSGTDQPSVILHTIVSPVLRDVN